MMKPMSLYSARAPGAAASGVVKAACRSLLASLGAQEKLFVSGQAGAVREQHAQSDFAAARIIVGSKAPANSGTIAVTGSFEIEQAALVEDHRHGGRGDDFSQRSKIEDARGCDLGRSRIICEAADRALWATSSPRKVTASEQAGKARAAMAFSRMPKALRKRSSCASEIAREEGKAGFSIGQRQVQGCFVN